MCSFPCKKLYLANSDNLQVQSLYFCTKKTQHELNIRKKLKEILQKLKILTGKLPATEARSLAVPLICLEKKKQVKPSSFTGEQLPG